MKRLSIICIAILMIASCDPKIVEAPSPISYDAQATGVSPFWKNAMVYFLLTDRFNNGDPTNDQSFDRKHDGATLRSFEGGDIKGVTDKIEEGYFDKLGVNAIWTTPVIEQIKGSTDEGTGKTWAYHGYWARDWTQLDPNFGTDEDFSEFVSTAHEHGIRVILDVVINHTGPVTDIDQVWPSEWVRTSPKCDFTNYNGTVECTLVENLPDLRTESDAAVDLPVFLLEKWEKEGKLKSELASLDAFFNETGLPRAPRFYIMKWFVDWVRKYGIDGFRIDTAKHTEASIWAELKALCQRAFEDWKKENPEKVIDNEEFYMVGEVYNFFIDGERSFDYGDQSVDFYENGFESLINFSFKTDAEKSYEEIFSKYNNKLNGGSFDGVSVLNYISSHDDGGPFDVERKRSIEAATKLLLCPGGVQIYYGDETARSLIIDGTEGDATLRSFMNWDELESDNEKQALITHWQKLGQFRTEHPSVGAGVHKQINDKPYVFKRTLRTKDEVDQVVVALDSGGEPITIVTRGIFEDGTKLFDYYSNQNFVVQSGKVNIDTDYNLVLLGIDR